MTLRRTLLWICLALACMPPSAVAEKREVRVGILAFQDFREALGRYDRIFSDLEEASGGSLEFDLAVGTYGDLLHWFDKGLVDVGVVSPGVFAELMQRDENGGCEYLASAGLRLRNAGGAQDSPRYRYEYHSVCVVSKGSGLNSLDDLRRAVSLGRVRFIFVHPLSVSGRIVPEFALRSSGILPTSAQMEYSYSHSNSLKLLAEEEHGVDKVAFVWDDALSDTPDKAKFRSIPFPELEKMSIPSDVVVSAPGSGAAEELSELFKKHLDGDGHSDFDILPDWKQRYGEIRRWRSALDLESGPVDTQTVSLREICQILRHYAMSQPSPPRLALVLSGGGAKCSYQVGAAAAVEEALSDLRRDNPGMDADIGLVVGTSGGAMNALPAALGISSDAEGRNDFHKVWTGLDQRRLVCPSEWLRSNIGLWWACFHALWITWVVRRIVGRVEMRGWWTAALFILLALVQLYFGYTSWRPWHLLGDGHGLHHLWLLGFFGARWSGWCLLFAGAAAAACQWSMRSHGHHIKLDSRWVPVMLIFALVGLPLMQIIVVFLHETTLSEGTGIEAELSHSYPWMIDQRLGRGGLSPLELGPDLSNPERLRAMGREILERRLLKRDLVLTGSCLSQSSSELPSDLYFYAGTDPSRTPPRYGSRGIPLENHPSILMDVVMGSGSIFPMFPPRLIRDFPQPGQQVELVDGGFSHNSPVEAATLWGATHVILIQASPETRSVRGSFLNNSVEAFNHLYSQAQLLDTQSKGKVEIFTLAPSSPHICVIDFADNLVEATIEKGYAEANGRTDGSPAAALQRPSFRKELGEPLFWHAGSAAARQEAVPAE